MDNNLDKTMEVFKDAEKKVIDSCIDNIRERLLGAKEKKVYVYYDLEKNDDGDDRRVDYLYLDLDNVCVYLTTSNEYNDWKEYLCIDGLCNANEIYGIAKKVESVLGSETEENVKIREKRKKTIELEKARKEEVKLFEKEFKDLLDKHVSTLDNLRMGIKVNGKIVCTHYKGNEYITEVKDADVNNFAVFEWYD